EALFGYTAAEAYALPLTAIFPGVVDNVVFAGGVSEAAGPDPAEAPIPSFELPARHKTGAPFAVALAVWPTDSCPDVRRTLVVHVTDVIDRTLASRQRDRLLEESHALQAIAAELASTRESATLLDAIVDRTMAVLGADIGIVYLVDEQGRIQLGANRGG